MNPDIIVIGGGIAGLSAAAELSRAARVLLVEAERAQGYHASGRSAAMFLPFYGNRVVRALNEASADALSDAGVLARRAFLKIAPPHRLEVLESAVLELGLRRIAPDDAASILPILNADALAGAAVTDRSWEIDTDLLMQGYRKGVLARDGEIRLEARIDGIEYSGGHWRLSWPEGDAVAPLLVNAAGAWADAVAELAGLGPLGLVPHRRSMAQLTAPAGHDVDLWPFVEQAGEDWYAKPDAGRWLVSPADEDPVAPGDVWADDMVLAEGLARYQDTVTVPVTRPLVTWAGLRTIAPDRTLVVGRDPRAAGFWWCAGQAGYGFQTAPAVASLLARSIRGATPDLPADVVAALDPARLV